MTQIRLPACYLRGVAAPVGGFACPWQGDCYNVCRRQQVPRFLAGQTVVKRTMWRWIWVCGVGIGAIGMAAPARAARWHEYLATTSVAASIDRTSLRSNHIGHKTFLARTVLKRGERRAHGSRYRPGTVILSRQEIDCRRQRIRLVDYVVRDPGGATLDTGNAAGAHWMRIRPGTLAARSAAYVCARR
jgi:hypothetical protein